MRLFDSALLIAVKPGICGSSGTVPKNLSRPLLNSSTVQPVLFLMDAGSVLKSLGPWTGKLEYLSFCMDAGAWVFTGGTWQLRLCGCASLPLCLLYQELRCWSRFWVNYFLRYYLVMQHQPIVKRVNGTHEWAHRPYQLLITAACTNTGGKMKGSHPRAAGRCPFVPRHS